MIDQVSSYLSAFDVATRYFDRCGDPRTRALRDELAQEAAIEAWRRCGEVREPRRFASYVRTISRRLRSRALGIERDRTPRPIGDVAEVVHGERVPSLWVEGERFEQRELLDLVDHEIARLGSLNERLLRGFYEGFSCRELAVRYGVDEDVVKARLYRSRRRIRRAAMRRLRSGRS